MRYALIIGTTVANVIEASEEFAQQLQGYDVVLELEPGQACAPGHVWNGSAEAPAFAAPVQPDQPRHVTRLAFRQRFSAAEKAGLTYAARQATEQGAAIQAYLDDVQAATYIDLDRPDTRDGVLQLEALDLLGEGRALEILDAPIQDVERPQ